MYTQKLKWDFILENGFIRRNYFFSFIEKIFCITGYDGIKNTQSLTIFFIDT